MCNVESTASFSVGEVIDSSGFTLESGKKDTFDPREAMRVSLQPRLEAGNPPDNDSPKYTINVDIKGYAPKNAASLAYLVISPITFGNLHLGEDGLGVIATILDQEGNEQATIATGNIGSGFNLLKGKYISVFDKVSDEIVEVIRDTKKRITKSEYDKKMNEALESNMPK